MKMFFALMLALSALPAFAASIELPDTLTSKQIEDVSTEFAVNFSHTTVSAPETEGLWGLEVGIVGGKSKSPELSDLVSETGEDGDDFENLFHAGAFARAHFPFDLFVELSLLPEREISDITISNSTFGVGWNAGEFFNLPLDIALGVNFSKSKISYEQQINNASTGNVAVNSDIDFDAKTRVAYLGFSKNFLFFTPYFKVGTAKMEADVEVTASGTNGTIFASGDQSESASNSGGYYALGANLQLLMLRFGVEVSKTIDVGRASAKLAIAF